MNFEVCRSRLSILNSTSIFLKLRLLWNEWTMSIYVDFEAYLVPIYLINWLWVVRNVIPQQQNNTKISQIHIKHFQYPPRQIPYPQRYPTPPVASGPNHRPNHPWPPPANSHAHPNHPTSPHQSPVHAPSPSPQPPQPANSPHQVNTHDQIIIIPPSKWLFFCQWIY